MVTMEIITLIVVLAVLAVLAAILAIITSYFLYIRTKRYDGNCVESQIKPGRQTSGLSVDSSIFRETLRHEQDNDWNLDISTTTNISLDYDTSFSRVSDIRAGSLMFSSSSPPDCSPYQCSTPNPPAMMSMDGTTEYRCQTESSRYSLSLPKYQLGEVGSLLESILEEVGEKGEEENNEVMSYIESPFRCLPFTPADISSYSQLPTTKVYLEDDNNKNTLSRLEDNIKMNTLSRLEDNINKNTSSRLEDNINMNTLSRNISKSTNLCNNVLEYHLEDHQDYSHRKLSCISEDEYDLEDITDILDIDDDNVSLKSSLFLLDIDHDETILPRPDNIVSFREGGLQSSSSFTDLVYEDEKSRPIYFRWQSPSCPLLYRVLVNTDNTCSKFISLSI